MEEKLKGQLYLAQLKWKRLNYLFDVHLFKDYCGMRPIHKCQELVCTIR